MDYGYSSDRFESKRMSPQQALLLNSPVEGYKIQYEQSESWAKFCLWPSPVCTPCSKPMPHSCAP